MCEKRLSSAKKKTELAKCEKKRGGIFPRKCGEKKRRRARWIVEEEGAVSVLVRLKENERNEKMKQNLQKRSWWRTSVTMHPRDSFLILSLSLSAVFIYLFVHYYFSLKKFLIFKSHDFFFFG